MKKRLIILLIIMITAFILRFFRLWDYPALNADEAALGYNAYSLIQTGKDEHGNLWPLSFQSFNDYKPGLYVYLTLPFIKFFGLNEMSVRFPSAFLGVSTVLAIYFLVNELFAERNDDQNLVNIPLIASFMLAINPWHIHFSRGGWEVNVAAFLVVLGIWFWARAMNRPLYFVVSAISFALTFYTYHSTRLVVPLIVISLTIIYFKKIRVKLKYFLLSGLIGLLFLIPLLKDVAKPEVLSRASGVWIFTDPGTIERINEQRGEHDDLQSGVSRLLHNKPVNYTLAFLENWSEHYQGEFLFMSGDDIQRNKVPETGQMYMRDLIFVLAGFGLVMSGWKRSSEKSKLGWKVILVWLLLAPTAASLTFQSPHALRAHNMVIPLTVISAYGMHGILVWLGSKKSYGIYVMILLFAVIAWEFMKYQLMYWRHMAKAYPFSSQYGVKNLVSFINYTGDRYSKIVVTNKYDQPYILFLFYLKYPPEQFQALHTLTARDNYGFSTVAGFDKYIFKNIDWQSDNKNYPDSLLVGTDEDIPDDANLMEEIFGLNNYKYFQIVESGK